MSETIFDFEVEEPTAPLESEQATTEKRLELLENEDHEEEQTLRTALRYFRRSSLSSPSFSDEQGLVMTPPPSPELRSAGDPSSSSSSSTGTGSPISHETPLIIGISGGTASGKTSVCKAINDQLRDQRVALITLDSYYRPLEQSEKELVAKGEFNFDHPSAFDWALVREHLAAILQRKAIRVPSYDYINNERFPDKDTQISNVDVVFFEGILAFYDPIVRDMLCLKIFVECDSDIRLARRVIRDIAERGRDLDHILDQYEKTVKPSFDKFTLPTKRFADVIIPRGAANTVAIKLLADHFHQKLLLTSSHMTELYQRKRRTTSERQHARAEAKILDADRSKQT